MADANLDLSELIARPREALDIEIKEWLDLNDADHRAKIGKEIIALANHGGGYLVLGLIEDASGGFKPDPRMLTDVGFSQDIIQDIVEKYVEPTLQCELRREPVGSAGTLPIVLVPSTAKVPTRARAGSPDGKLVLGRVYIRKPGPKSEEPKTAAEWDQLFERCIRARTDDLLDTIRALLSGRAISGAPPSSAGDLDNFAVSAVKRWGDLTSSLPDRVGAKFPDGFYEIAAEVDPPFTPMPLPEFRDTFRRALRNHSGWPPFVYLDRDPYRPKPIDDAIEAWVGPDTDGSIGIPAHSDFWRASPKGLFFTRFGFAEDGRFEGLAPGTGFDLTNSTWRLGEALLEIFYVCRAVGAEGSKITLHLKLAGLRGRRLVSKGNPRRMWSAQSHVAAQDQYVVRKLIDVAAIDQNLPELVFELLQPAYALFDFFELPRFVVEEELKEMRRNHYTS